MSGELLTFHGVDGDSGAEFRALSQIPIASDALLVAPENPDKVDDALWMPPLGMVEQARAELLKTAGPAMAGLLDAAKAR